MDFKLKKYLDESKNLPDFMRDFHDQKDLFKAIFQQFSESKSLKDINWRDAHLFTIDCFLWWMGIHGYKLQKIRSKEIEFADPNDTVEYFTKKRSDSTVGLLKEIIEERKSKGI